MSFFNSFALLPLPLRWRRQDDGRKLPGCSLPPPCCCPAPRPASSCPPVSEWLPSMHSHPLKWLSVECFSSLVHHLASPLHLIMQLQAQAMMNRTRGIAVSTSPLPTSIQQHIRDIVEPRPADATAPPPLLHPHHCGVCAMLIAPELGWEICSEFRGILQLIRFRTF